MSGTAPKRGLRLPRWLDKVFLAFGLVLLAYVVSRYPLADLSDACAKLGPLVILSPIIAVGWIVCNTCALYLLLDRRVPWLRLLRIRLVGDGYNALLPLAGMGGEPYRMKHISMIVPVDETLTALIRDRVIENAVGLAFSATWIGVGLARYDIESSSMRASMLGFVAIASGIAVGATLLMVTSLPGKLSAWLARVFGVKSQNAVRLPRSRFASILFWYMCARLVGVLEVTTLLWLLGLPFDPLTDLFMYSMLQAAGFIGFAIPAGLGVYEGTSVYMFGLLGFAEPLGVAFALARRARMLVVGLLGVSLHLIGLRSARRDAARTPTT